MLIISLLISVLITFKIYDLIGPYVLKCLTPLYWVLDYLGAAYSNHQRRKPAFNIILFLARLLGRINQTEGRIMDKRWDKKQGKSMFTINYLDVFTNTYCRTTMYGKADFKVGQFVTTHLYKKQIIDETAYQASATKRAYSFIYWLTGLPFYILVSCVYYVLCFAIICIAFFSAFLGPIYLFVFFCQLIS